MAASRSACAVALFEEFLWCALIVLLGFAIALCVPQGPWALAPIAVAVILVAVWSVLRFVFWLARLSWVFTQCALEERAEAREREGRS